MSASRVSNVEAGLPQSTGAGLVRAGAQLLAAGAAASVIAALLLLGGSMGSYPGTFGHALIMQAPGCMLWAALFPFIRRAVRRWPPDPDCFAASLARHGLLALGFAFLHWLLTNGVLASIGHSNLFNGTVVEVLRALLVMLPLHVALYTILLAAILSTDWLRAQRERNQLLEQLASARLHTLRAQLNPHFLFNALNSIAMLVRGARRAEAVHMISNLSDLLRQGLSDVREDVVPLTAELEFVRKYLAIEQIRYGERLVVGVSHDDAAAGACVPPLILQPLVENAIKHGIARLPGPGIVRVEAGVAAGMLTIAVHDNGPGLKRVTQGTGIGIGNIRERLRTHYGDRALLELTDSPGGGTRARIRIPHADPLPPRPATSVGTADVEERRGERVDIGAGRGDADGGA